MPEDREIPVEREPEVISGEDRFPREPAQPLDPFTPEPGPRPGERRAFRVMLLAFIPIAVAVGYVVYAAVR